MHHEEVEPIDELSTKTLKTYSHKAHDDIDSTVNDAAKGKPLDMSKIGKRARGLENAKTKIAFKEDGVCTPLDKVKEMAKASHKKIRKETLGIAPDNSTGI